MKSVLLPHPPQVEGLGYNRKEHSDPEDSTQGNFECFIVGSRRHLRVL